MESPDGEVLTVGFKRYESSLQAQLQRNGNQYSLF